MERQQIEQILEKLAEVLEHLPSQLSFRDDLSSPWLTIADAAKRGGFSDGYVRSLCGTGRLYLSGTGKGQRIWRDHFDVQLAMGFPRLDFEMAHEYANRMVKERENAQDHIPAIRSDIPKKPFKLHIPKASK